MITRKLILTLLAAAILPVGIMQSQVAGAQQKSKGTVAIHGDYSGALGPMHVNLHLTVGADGTQSGTLDSPDQGRRACHAPIFISTGRRSASPCRWFTAHTKAV